MSDQLDSVSRQIRDRSIARELQSIGLTMRDLMRRRVKPLMKLQDDLVYRLALLELQVQSLWHQVNQSISRLKTVQYYVDHQGEKIAQLVGDTHVLEVINYEGKKMQNHRAVFIRKEGSWIMIVIIRFVCRRRSRTWTDWWITWINGGLTYSPK